MRDLSEMASNKTNSTTLCHSHLPPKAATMTLSLFYTALFILSTLGNILALCLACQKSPKKINSTGIYLVHLAVSDLLFALALPGKITYYALESSWPFGDWFCRLTAFIFYLNTYGSVYLMTCLSVDRYLAVVCIHQCPQLRKTSQARLVCVGVWALALLQTDAFKLSLQVTVSLMNMSCCIDPVIYFFASKDDRKWLFSILKLRVSASSSSSTSSETRHQSDHRLSAPVENKFSAQVRSIANNPNVVPLGQTWSLPGSWQKGTCVECPRCLCNELAPCASSMGKEKQERRTQKQNFSNTYSPLSLINFFKAVVHDFPIFCSPAHYQFAGHSSGAVGAKSLENPSRELGQLPMTVVSVMVGNA
ncbi:PREDICTED: G-protein coupled receptor 183-like [Chrysochloris asiatica]|uniref:G-protein coupled receptor 183-like n=1 Tax=Chrysochloris asiatica TaxID=185453 RepID=A0A9B0T622_CHRAS|nr:PREDICTED: G-protein coupled receptor 183-like [Chrysochloris asiatica]